MSVNAVTVLKAVMADQVQIDEQERKDTVKIVEMFVKGMLIATLKSLSPSGSMFAILYREIFHTGSYYDGVRVGDAREFDLNMVFNLPVPDTFLKIEDKQVDQGFVKIGITKEMSVVLAQSHPLSKHEAEFTRTFLERDTNTGVNYLLVDKMRRWMEGLLTKALDKIASGGCGNLTPFGIKKVNKVSTGGKCSVLGRFLPSFFFTNNPPASACNEVTLRKSGPALTLLVDTIKYGLVEVDLVPAFSFKLIALKDHPRIYPEIKSMGGSFFVIPKKSTKDVKNGDRQWRLSFPEQERLNFITGQGPNSVVKPVIKLLKTFRDKNAVMNGLSSYSLKTVVMQMLKSKKNYEMWTNEKNMADLFIQALEKLSDYLDKKRIPHIFDHQSNLLWDMKDITKTEKKTWLDKVINKLQESKDQVNCREVWMKYF